MLADPQFGVVGLALLPLVFFYISSKLTEQFRFLIIFFFSLGILSAFMAIATVAESMTGGLKDSFAWLNYGLIILWMFYILFELMNLGFVWVINIVQKAQGGGRR